MHKALVRGRRSTSTSDLRQGDGVMTVSHGDGGLLIEHHVEASK